MSDLKDTQTPPQEKEKKGIFGWLRLKPKKEDQVTEQGQPATTNNLVEQTLEESTPTELSIGKAEQLAANEDLATQPDSTTDLLSTKTTKDLNAKPEPEPEPEPGKLFAITSRENNRSLFDIIAAT